MMFVIDRKDDNRIYYINSRRYPWHIDFVKYNYLALQDRKTFFENNYQDSNRRFILGNVVYFPTTNQYSYEFNEADIVTPSLISLTDSIVNHTFFTHVYYRPVSPSQEELARQLPDIRSILTETSLERQEYQFLNLGTAVGKLRFIDHIDSTTILSQEEIIVLNEPPLDLSPISGIIVTKPSTTLSHPNILARSWNIPNAYIKYAWKDLRGLEDKWVTLTVEKDTFAIRAANSKEIEKKEEELSERRSLSAPRGNIEIRKIASLHDQRKKHARVYGAKSANLGEMLNQHLEGLNIPFGITLPFAFYTDYLKENGFDTLISNLLSQTTFKRNAALRKKELTALRTQLEHGILSDSLTQQILQARHQQLGNRALFIRSSTNNEDLPNFSGAGLYTTVPNVISDSDLIQAVKTVWASVWNTTAYEVRERAGIDHSKVYMAVLLQEAINSESSGVMITRDPFANKDIEAVYISAKRGLGLKVVNGTKVAEQIIYHPATRGIRILTRSEEDELLTLDSLGGVRSVPIKQRTVVLTEDLTHQLAELADEIYHIFGEEDQDIEWAYSKGTVYILQSRPYISKQ